MTDRSYKFRAWIRQDEWDEESKNQAYEMCYDLAFEEYEPINDLLASVEHLMQYTGLKDKNGKEIYEGDIVIGFPTGNQPAIVDFAHGAFMTYWKARDEWRWLYQPTYVWEVIGNIWENPKLIKEVK